MLDTLLRTLSEGGTYSHADLATRLGVGEDLVHQMVEDLVRMGYLKAVSGSCEQNCGECALSNRCTVGGGGRAWTLTEKGIRAAGRAKSAAG